MDLPPQHISYSANSTGNRIKKSPRWGNDEGVAATVGTIMSLLVFISLMGIFTNQFVPVWMSDNESTHMSTVIEQFINLKSSIDISISNNPNSLIAPSPIFVPITLSAPGIPVFAASTAGILSLSPQTANQRPSLDLTYQWVSTVSGSPTPYTLNSSNDGASGGNLDLYCPNRYFVEQHITYEGGAVILNQSDGDFIIAGPQLAVRNMGSTSNPNWTIMMTQVTVEGQNNTIGGIGSKGVVAEVKFADTNSLSNPVPTDLRIDIASPHGLAWKSYFNRTLAAAGMVVNTDYTLSYTLVNFPSDHTKNYYIVTIIIKNVGTLDHTRATVTLSIGELGII
jgi:hypothetical protein